MKKNNTKNKLKNNHVGVSQILSEVSLKKIVLTFFIIIILVYMLYHLNDITSFLKKIVDILSPIIVGFILTYLLSPFYDLIIVSITKKKEKYVKDKSKRARFAKVLATIICTATVLLVAIGLAFLFVPQLYSSITSFANRANGYLEGLQLSLSNLKDSNTAGIFEQLLSNLQKAIDSFLEKGFGDFIDINKLFVGVYNGFYLSFKVVLNAFVGLVVMIYALNMKVELYNGAKRLIYAIFSNSVARSISAEVAFAHKVFSGFLIGKILDSLIIGILCYFSCLIMHMPYTPLISVIVGVTNVIPFFGPFIGAVPCFIIIFLDQPFTWRPYGFILFAFILQQIDGNIIGPKILGDKTGVGSFWVLFSILLFGGLFGFVGMIVAVPLWAILTRLLDRVLINRLRAKGETLTKHEYERYKAYEEEVKIKNSFVKDI